MGSLSRESILREMSGVEAKYQTVLGQVAATSSQMTLLEANGQFWGMGIILIHKKA